MNLHGDFGRRNYQKGLFFMINCVIWRNQLVNLNWVNTLLLKLFQTNVRVYKLERKSRGEQKTNLKLTSLRLSMFVWGKIKWWPLHKSSRNISRRFVCSNVLSIEWKCLEIPSYAHQHKHWSQRRTYVSWKRIRPIAINNKQRKVIFFLI